jgi:hypothetical protein
LIGKEEIMQADEAWIAMFRRIPVQLHEVLALGLTTGAEIVVQKIVKLEPDFMIIRGRLAGTQDAGRVVLIPYGQLTFVAMLRDLKEAEIESIFGKGALPVAVDLPPVNTEEPEPAVQEPAEGGEPASEKKSGALARGSMLAKLRERMKDAGK